MRRHLQKYKWKVVESSARSFGTVSQKITKIWSKVNKRCKNNYNVLFRRGYYNTPRFNEAYISNGQHPFMISDQSYLVI